MFYLLYGSATGSSEVEFRYEELLVLVYNAFLVHKLWPTYIQINRVQPDKPPFTYVGVDFFGPLFVKQGRSRVKRYGCLFTCLVIQAIHIEIAHSLDVSSFIDALRRFIAHRGRPEEIRSDRGTNFIGAERELKNL